jgi:transcriptional regulator GlxA family with amidase domain
MARVEDTRAFVRDVLTLIEQRFHDDLSLSCVARAVAMSPAHLTDTIGATPGGRCINGSRIAG